MKRACLTAFTGLIATVGLSACSSEVEAEAQTLVAQELPKASARVSAKDAAEPESETPDAMESGSSEDEGARKPDPKRSKLIKADPN